MTASDFINEKTFYDNEGRGQVFRDVAEEYTKLRAIAFANFCGWHGEFHKGFWRGNVLINEPDLSTEELYQLFSLAQEQKVDISTDFTPEESAQWIITNVRLNFRHISEESEDVFNMQTDKTIKWLTNKFHLIHKKP